MQSHHNTRRNFLAASLAAATAAQAATTDSTAKPALLGGAKAMNSSFPGWPVRDDLEVQSISAVVKSGKWGRGVGERVMSFEKQFSELMKADHCLATSSGTAALLTSLNVMGIGPGDEVIVSPYTFVASVNIILACHALPVFADTDPETLQIDAKSIESRITGRTAAILPVHLGGGTFDVDAVQAIARKHNLSILEDSCQSHLAEWKTKRTGTFGTAGCFSFQASKNLNSGEGGAILSSDEGFIQRCYEFHNNGRGRVQPGVDFSYTNRGLNLRLTEFQGQLLMNQMSRLDEQSRKREQNAQHLGKMLAQIGGLTQVKMSSGCTRNAYHLYMMRYDSREFGGLPRAKFLKAMNAEGVPASSGYSPLNKEPYLKNSFDSRGFQRIYSKERIRQWLDTNQCPGNDRACNEAVWFTQNMLLGSRSDMESIAAAVQKIKKYGSELARA